MARIGFVGVGKMGSLMARNLIKAGHSLKVYDLSEEAVNFVVQSGAKRAQSVKDAASGVDFVVTMLPVGGDVRAVFLDDGVLAAADRGTMLIDSSTIDVETARAVHAAAAERGYAMLDAPVSGGVAGAEAATLTFMCGGDKATFQKALPVLQGMGKNIVHCGGAGFGQVSRSATTWWPASSRWRRPRASSWARSWGSTARPSTTCCRPRRRAPSS